MPMDIPVTHAVFSDFEPISLSMLLDIVLKLKSTFSPQDIVPTKLLRQVIEVIGPFVLLIIKKNLLSGIVPIYCKHAIVQPLLKKPNLDKSVLCNYIPISKLPFLAKILEKTVFNQLQSFLIDNAIGEVFQSGFKKKHSTESALLRVFSDIFMATDSGDVTLLLLLDLTAAFDTINHQILISRLETSVGIRGNALNWIKSYLQNRSFSVQMGECMSTSAPLSCGISQGSVLAPVLFSLYMLPLGQILSKYGVSFHCYADDTQLYLPLKPTASIAVERLVECFGEIKVWMSANLLCLNESKTKLILFGPSESADTSNIELGIFCNILWHYKCINKTLNKY